VSSGRLQRSAQESGWSFEESIRERLLTLLRFASARELVPKGQPFRLTQSFQLVTTTVEDATRWGAAHPTGLYPLVSRENQHWLCCFGQSEASALTVV